MMCCMASVQQLPSGKWRGRVKRDGEVVATFSHPLKGTVERWARDVERKLDAGEWINPKLGRLTVTEWYEQWTAHLRLVSHNTTVKDASHWRTHVKPRWGHVSLVSIEADDVRTWVRDMQRPDYRVGEPAGAHTIQGAVHLLASLLQAAVDGKRLTHNPAHGITLPTPDLKVPFFWSRDVEAPLLLGALAEPWRLMCDLDMYVGLRWAELAGLKRRAVDLDRGLLHVAGTQTRHGWVPITKGKALRTTPIPTHLVAPLAGHIEGLEAGDLVFTGARRAPLDDGNFRNRVFYPAIGRAGVRRGTPHDMRHTAASWLVMAGVDLYRVQALLGHESFRTTARYAHLAPDAHDALHAAWGRTG